MNSKAKSVTTLFLSLFLILTGCADRPDPVITIPIIKGPWHEIEVTKLLESATVQPLSTTPDCLIGDDFFFLDYTDEFYILDKTVEKIFRFGSNGDFLNPIGKPGKGSGEYIRLTDGILCDENTIELLTGFPSAEVSAYLTDGTFLSKKAWVECWCSSFVLSHGMNSYFFAQSFLVNKVLQMDRSTGARKDSFLTNVVGVPTMGLRGLSTSGEHAVLFCEPMINKVYEITSAGISEKYRLDFGKYSIEEDPGIEELQNRMRDPGFWLAIKVLENKQFVYLYTEQDLPETKPHFQQFIYRKEDKSLWTLTDEAGFSASLGPAFHLTDADELFLFLNPSDAISSKPWLDFFYSRGLGLQASDNPVVITLNLNRIIQN